MMNNWQSLAARAVEAVDHIAHQLEHMTYLRLMEASGSSQHCLTCGQMFNPKPREGAGDGKAT